MRVRGCCGGPRPLVAVNLDPLKKEVLIVQVQQQLQGKRWLPYVLRARD